MKRLFDTAGKKEGGASHFKCHISQLILICAEKFYDSINNLQSCISPNKNVILVISATARVDPQPCTDKHRGILRSNKLRISEEEKKKKQNVTFTVV